MLSGRLQRALRRGAIVYKVNSTFTVYRDQDRRRAPLGVLMKQDAEALIRAGKLSELGLKVSGADAFIWSDRPTKGPKAPNSTPILSPPVLPSAVARHPRRGAALLDRLLADEPPLPNRLAKAASRFLNDSEQAATPPCLTTNWAAFASPSASTAPRTDDLGGRHRQAVGLLEKLEAELGVPTLGLLDMVVVRQLSRASLARRLGLNPQAAEVEALAALERLADAYDQSIPRAR